jgi:RHS repeat-associated protein
MLTIRAIHNPQVNPADNKFYIADGYGYDSEGNLTSNPEGKTFSYNAENKQTLAYDSVTQTTAGYDYDGNGKRVKKTVGNQETVFLYDAFGKLTAEYTTNQTITIEGTKYLTSDLVGSPRATTNNLGQVASRHDYMPFGEEIAATVANRNQVTGYTVNDRIRQQFTGYERDGESGLDFAQNRYFAARHGRFTSVDPLAASASSKNPQTLNRYSYALNSPYKFTDPLGLRPCGRAGDEKPNGNNCSHAEDDDLRCRAYGRCSDDSSSLQGDSAESTEPNLPGGNMPDTVSEAMVLWLMSIESFRTKPYSTDKNKSGNCTIGYGHLINRGPCSADTLAKYKDGISKEEAKKLFEQDLEEKAVAYVRRNVTVDLNQNQFDALVSLSFRIGGTSFANSEVVEQLNSGNYDAGGDKILNWGGAKTDGQRDRAIQEWSRFFGGEIGVSASASADRTPLTEYRIVLPNRTLPKIPN